jgi:hypothetical protein
MAGVPSSTPFLTTMSRPGRDATRIRPSGVAATAVGLATAATRVSVKPDGTVASAGTTPTAINDTVSTDTTSDGTKNDDTKNDDTKNDHATRRKRNRIKR